MTNALLIVGFLLLIGGIVLRFAARKHRSQ